jgi:hypothetical protein
MTPEWPIDARRAAHEAGGAERDDLDLALAHLSETIDRLPNIGQLQRSHNRLLAAAKWVRSCPPCVFGYERAQFELDAAIAEAEKLS